MNKPYKIQTTEIPIDGKMHEVMVDGWAVRTFFECEGDTISMAHYWAISEGYKHIVDFIIEYLESQANEHEGTSRELDARRIICDIERLVG